jgi:hypothetical protein
MNKEYEILLDDFQSFMNTYENNLTTVSDFKELYNNPIKTIIDFIVLSKKDIEININIYKNISSKLNDKELFFFSMYLYYNISTKEELNNLINPLFSSFNYSTDKSLCRIFIDLYLLNNFNLDPNRKKYNNSKIKYVYTFEGIMPIPPILESSYILNDKQYSIFLYRTGKIDGICHSSKDASLFFKLTSKEISSLYGKAYSSLYHLEHPTTHITDILLNNN